MMQHTGESSVGDSETLSEASQSASQVGVADDVQLVLALHNCNEVLQFDSAQRMIIKGIFTESHSTCALFVWQDNDDAADTDAEAIIVAASPLLSELFYPNSSMPQPLASLISGDTSAKIIATMRVQRFAVHQWPHETLMSGTPAKITTFALNPLSPVASSSSVKLGILCAEFLGMTYEHLPSQLVWHMVDRELVCIGSDPEANSSPTQIQAVLPTLVTPLLLSITKDEERWGCIRP